MENPKLRKKLLKFQLNPEARPFVVEPDLILLFRNLPGKAKVALQYALIIQRVSHLVAKKKKIGLRLSLSIADLEEIFPFISHRTLTRIIYNLRDYRIWRSRPYKKGEKTYRNIRINWNAVACLAKQIRRQKEKKRQNNGKL